MNWPWPLDVHLFLNPAKITKKGLSEEFAQSQNIENQDIFSWTSKYASVSTIMSGIHTGNEPTTIKPYTGFEQATADGMNEKGLVVNALAEVDVDYGSPISSEKLLSSLRWGQYVLDCFASVKDAVKALASPEYRVINQGIPDSSEKQGKFHLCLSDSLGDSAIIEYENGNPRIYMSPDFRVVTNQPNYEAQLILNSYWQYQWGLAEVKNKNVVHTAPGGSSSTQLFERASYNLSFSKPMPTTALAIGQSHSLMTSNAVPIHFNKKKFTEDSGHAAYTVWTNIAAHFQKRYYFINSLIGNGGYLDIDDELSQCLSVKVMDKSEQEQKEFEKLNGDISPNLTRQEYTPFEVN